MVGSRRKEHLQSWSLHLHMQWTLANIYQMPAKV